MKSRKFVSKDELDEVALIRIVYRLSMTKGQGRDLREYSRVRVQMKPIRPLGVDISRKNRLRLSMTNLVKRVKAKRRGVKPSEHLRGSICSVAQVRLDGIYSSTQPAKGRAEGDDVVSAKGTELGCGGFPGFPLLARERRGRESSIASSGFGDE